MFVLRSIAMTSKIKGLNLEYCEKYFTVSIDCLEFRNRLPNIKKLFVAQFLIILSLFLSMFIFGIKGLLVAMICAGVTRIIFQEIIYYYANLKINMRKFATVLVLITIVLIATIFTIKSPKGLVFLSLLSIIPCIAMPIFHKNQICLFAMSKNPFFIFSSIFSYICISFSFFSFPMFIMAHLFTFDTPLEDAWFFMIFILSALLASGFDLIGILTATTKKVSKRFLYIVFGLVYILSFCVWYLLISFPSIVKFINLKLFYNLKDLFIMLFF